RNERRHRRSLGAPVPAGCRVGDHDPRGGRAVALAMAGGPFGQHPAGTFDFAPPERVTYVEPLGRRVRAVLAGRTVVDTDAVRLVHETGKLPRYLFPADAVDVAGQPHPAAPGWVTVAWDAVDAW